MASRSTEVALCFDLGGTKLRAAHVTSRGRILETKTHRIDQSAGFDGLIELFRTTANELQRRKFSVVSVASAGPLDPGRGLLLDPTNFTTRKKSWGVLPLKARLRKVFRKRVIVENDAAAAVLGEKWRGGLGRTRNLVAITVGTGVGIGVMCNGELVRAGRGLHTELSHASLNAEDTSRPCGCGAFGCIESYLAGSQFTRRVAAHLGREVHGSDVVSLADQGDAFVRAAFEDYGLNLARAIRFLSIGFAPEVIVLSGGFSHAARLFLNETERELPKLLKRYREGVDLLPEVKVSRLQDDAGVLGAAFLAFRGQ